MTRRSHGITTSTRHFHPQESDMLQTLRCESISVDCCYEQKRLEHSGTRASVLNKPFRVFRDSANALVRRVVRMVLNLCMTLYLVFQAYAPTAFTTYS